MTGQLSPIQKELIAGLTTGALTTVVVHPLDLVKIRLQLLATNSKHLGYRYIFSSIYRSASNKNVWQEGLAKELYRGLSINLLGNGIAWSLYFGLYRISKDIIYGYNFNYTIHLKDTTERDSKLSSLMYLSAGALSGLVTSVLTNPIWVVKTRIMSTSSRDNRSYSSILNGVKRIFNEEGSRSFWKGLIPSLFGVSQGAIYFMIYDTLKHNVSSLSDASNRKDNKKGLKNSETFLISSISKIFSVSSVYPFQLIKSNLQSFDANEKKYTIRKLTRSIYAVEGLRGFYKGLAANLLRGVPSSCITFGIYENLKNWL